MKIYKNSINTSLADVGLVSEFEIKPNHFDIEQLKYLRNRKNILEEKDTLNKLIESMQ